MDYFSLLPSRAVDVNGAVVLVSESILNLFPTYREEFAVFSDFSQSDTPFPVGVVVSDWTETEFIKFIEIVVQLELAVKNNINFDILGHYKKHQDLNFERSAYKVADFLRYERYVKLYYSVEDPLTIDLEIAALLDCRSDYHEALDKAVKKYSPVFYKKMVKYYNVFPNTMTKFNTMIKDRLLRDLAELRLDVAPADLNDFLTNVAQFPMLTPSIKPQIKNYMLAWYWNVCLSKLTTPLTKAEVLKKFPGLPLGVLSAIKEIPEFNKIHLKHAILLKRERENITFFVRGDTIVEYRSVEVDHLWYKNRVWPVCNLLKEWDRISTTLDERHIKAKLVEYTKPVTYNDPLQDVSLCYPKQFAQRYSDPVDVYLKCLIVASRQMNDDPVYRSRKYNLTLPHINTSLLMTRRQASLSDNNWTVEDYELCGKFKTNNQLYQTCPDYLIVHDATGTKTYNRDYVQTGLPEKYQDIIDTMIIDYPEDTTLISEGYRIGNF